MAKEQFDVYAEVMYSIIRAMETGTPPCRKPWTGDQAGAAFPLRSTGELYQGINVLMPWLAAFFNGYRSAHWFTFKQAKAIGAGVRKGEKSSTFVKYGTIDKKDEETGLPAKSLMPAPIAFSMPTRSPAFPPNTMPPPPRRSAI